MRWTLMAQSQKILKSILNSVDDCPSYVSQYSNQSSCHDELTLRCSQFRQLFGHIKRCVDERFPEAVNTTIGGFIFLRFFCPAVSSPEAYGIVDGMSHVRWHDASYTCCCVDSYWFTILLEPPSASARRLLILITKVLQNLSNDVEFGSKEPYMTKMNDFIQSNRVKLTQFYERLVVRNSNSILSSICLCDHDVMNANITFRNHHLRHPSRLIFPRTLSKSPSLHCHFTSERIWARLRIQYVSFIITISLACH